VAGELEQVAVDTGGAYYALSDDDTVSAVIDAIDEREAGLFTGTRRLVVTDRPQGLVIAALLGVAGAFLLLWRVRL